MEKQHRFSVWYVLVAIWIVLILHNVIVQMFAVERLPYSDFVKALQSSRVTEVAITHDRIQGKMKVPDNGQEVEKAFTTVRVDSDLSELLEKYNVTFKVLVFPSAPFCWRLVFHNAAHCCPARQFPDTGQEKSQGIHGRRGGGHL
jgi:ATP-dependent Zn protease